MCKQHDMSTFFNNRRTQKPTMYTHKMEAVKPTLSVANGRYGNAYVTLLAFLHLCKREIRDFIMLLYQP